MSVSPSHSDSKYDDAVVTEAKLERVFREIEEASERRAMEEEEAASHPTPLDPFVTALPNTELAKKRRRKSISISRVGSYHDVPAELHRTMSGMASPVQWTAPPPYTHTPTVSTTSLATTSSFTSSNARHHVEEYHTTQKETIAGRRNTITKAVSSALSRTLTRIRSRGALNEVSGGDEALVIGVAVHEARTETTEVAEGAAPDEGRARARSVPEGEARNGSGAPEGSEPGPSRRLSVSVGAFSKKEVKRERSGSISKLRGKLPLRSQPTPLDLKQAAEDALMISGAGASTDVPIRDGEKTPSSNAKQGRRLSYFAKALAARLRRKKSEEAKEKRKEKGKEKDEGKQKAEGKTEKSDKQEQMQERYVPPAPILTPTASVRLDVTTVESTSLTPPTVAEASVPLPPSPRKIPSVTEIPLPPSPRTSSSVSTPASSTSMTVPRPLEPIMVPLPASPMETSFTVPILRVAEANAKAACTSAEPAESNKFKSRRGPGSSNSTAEPTLKQAQGERLPQSALPDSDFGPMTDFADEASPSPSETADATSAPMESISVQEEEATSASQPSGEESALKTSL